MMSKLRTLMPLSCLVILFLAYPARATMAGQNKIEGLVLDRRNNPVPGVLVRLYRGTTPLPNEKRTGTDGSYAIPFDSGEPITTVRYDLTNWFPSTVDNISGVKDHRINKVLIRVGEQLSIHDQLEIDKTFAKLRVVDMSNGMSLERFEAQNAAALSVYMSQRNFFDSRFFFGSDYVEDPNNSLQMYWHKQGLEKPYGLRTSLLAINKATAERVRDDSIRVHIEGRIRYSGWTIKTDQYLVNGVLHLQVLGEPPSALLSKESSSFSLTQAYDGVKEATGVMFRGSAGEIFVRVLGNSENVPKPKP